MKQFKFDLDNYGKANHPFSDGHSYVFNLTLPTRTNVGFQLNFDCEDSSLRPYCRVIVKPVPKTATLYIRPEGTSISVEFIRNFKNLDGNLVIRIVKNPNSPTISGAYCNGELIGDSQ
jgi:hypothetical protein